MSIQRLPPDIRSNNNSIRRPTPMRPNRLITRRRNHLQAVRTAARRCLRARVFAADPKICKVSIVGIGMRSHAGVASTMFRALSDEGINIQMITTSEIKTSVVIDEKYMELAVRALHKAFGLDAA